MIKWFKRLFGIGQPTSTSSTINLPAWMKKNFPNVPDDILQEILWTLGREYSGQYGAGTFWQDNVSKDIINLTQKILDEWEES